jgi:hypothetical protein
MSATEPRPDHVPTPLPAAPLTTPPPALPDPNAVLLGLVASIATAMLAAAIFCGVVVSTPRPHHGATHSAQLETQERQAMIRQAEAAQAAAMTDTPAPTEAKP